MFDTEAVSAGLFRGVLLGESLRLGEVLEVPELQLLRAWRADAGDPSAGQPRRWTFVEFEVSAERADQLTRVLGSVLEPTGGWYCSFGSDDEMVVVFAGRSFRYRRVDESARRDVEAYARSVGVPEAQLDWETGPPPTGRG
jgi:hypothetical protein